MKHISVIVPVFQNQENIQDTAQELTSLAERLPDCQLEIIFIDDGSTDQSWAEIQIAQLKYPTLISALKLTRNFGQTPAILAGLQSTQSDCAIVISADLQESPDLIPEMVAHWSLGSKFILAARKKREDGWLKEKLGGLYWFLIRFSIWKDYPRMGFDYCLVDRQLIDVMKISSEPHTVFYSHVYWLGFKPARLQTTRKRREKGKSQWTTQKKIKLTLDTLYAYSSIPSHLIKLSILGAVLATFFFPDLKIHLFFIGLAFLVTSGYMVRIHRSSQNRPLFVIDRFFPRIQNQVQRVTPNPIP